MQRFAEQIQPQPRLRDGRFHQLSHRVICGIAARNDVALLGRPRDGARSRIMQLRYDLRPLVVRADARIVEQRIQVLHIARIDAVVAGGDGLCLRGCVPRLQSQPLRQTEMNVAFERVHGRTSD